MAKKKAKKPKGWKAFDELLRNLLRNRRDADVRPRRL